MYIFINNQSTAVSIAYSIDRLSLSFTSEENLLDLYNMFQPSSMPEIVIYDETQGDITSAIYANHKVVAIHLMDTGLIQVDLQVDPLEISEARRISETLQAQLQEMLENNEVLNEMLAMLADHESRIKALEPPDPTDEIPDEGEDE